MTTNHATGHKAEKGAASYLQTIGYRIIELNWKTKYCEIDIVAEKNKTVYFVEVKYRKSAAQGDGFDYITPKKLKAMKFAAQMWLANHSWEGECSLAAVSASPYDYEITEVI